MHTSDDIDHANTVLGTLAGLVALGALLTYSLQAVARVQRRRRTERAAPVGERLQTWEGEGGRPTAVGQPEVTPDLAP